MIEFETLEEENQRLRIKIARLTREATPDPNYEDQIVELSNTINQNEFIIEKLQIDNEAQKQMIEVLKDDLEMWESDPNWPSQVSLYEIGLTELSNTINQNEFIIQKLQVDNEAKEKRIDSLIADLERLQRRIELYLIEVDENSQRLRHALAISRG